MRGPTTFLIVFVTLIVARGALAFQDPCRDIGKRTVNDLIDRWTWETFWDGRTSGFQYQPRARGKVDVFWDKDLIGMCSLDLGSCTAYEREGARLGQFASSEDRLRGPSLHQVTGAFLRRLNEPRIIHEDNNGKSQRQLDSAGRFERNGTVVATIPAPGSDVIIQRNAGIFQTCILTKKSFPPLGTPKAIRDKITPENFSMFAQWLEGRLHPPLGAKSEYVIPYFSPRDPLVYVLIRVNGITESIIFVLSRSDGTNWQIGGHFDSKESPIQVRRLEPLILAAKMTSIFR